MSTGPARTDRRVRRSQRELFRALMDLLAEKDYRSITVSEIAHRADVARATFYLHYDSKDALLLSGLDHAMDDVFVRMRSYSRDDLIRGAPHPALTLFEFVESNPVLAGAIIDSQGSTALLALLREFATRAVHLASEQVGARLAVPPNIMADYMAGAMLSVIVGWLEDDLRAPADEMAAVFHRMTRPMIMAVANVG